MKQATFDYVPDESGENSKIERKEAIDSSRETSKHKGAGQQTPTANAPDVSGDAGSTPAEVKIEGGTALAVIEIKKETALSIFTAENGLDPYIAELERQARASITGADVSTIAGQAIIRSVAYSVSKSKKPLENLAENLKKDAYALVDTVNAERDRGIKALDDLQKELRRPLTEYEEKDKARIAGHKDRLQKINDLAVFQGDVDAFGLQGRLGYLSASFKDVNWQEFTESAKTATESVTKTLTDMLEKAKKAEADAAELARLRSEEDERNRAWNFMYAEAHTENVAFDAAAKAKKDAEDEAERQRVAREAQVEQDKAAAQKVIDDQATALAVAETNRKNNHERNLQKLADMAAFHGENPPSAMQIQVRIGNLNDFEGIDWQEYQQQAVETKIRVTKELADFLHDTQVAEEKAAAEVKRLADEKAAQDRQEAADAAAKAERDKAAATAEEERKDTAVREADKAHRAKINNESLSVVQAIMDELFEQGKATPDIAKAIIIWIAEGKVPNVTIKY